MATYLTTYRAGVSKMTMAGNNDPADANSPPWDGTDDGHPSAADKHVDDRWPIDPPPPGYQGEVPPDMGPPPDEETAQVAPVAPEGGPV